MNRTLLEQPFKPEFIKQRKGRNNITLDYLETHIVIQRLNEAFDGNWSFEIAEYQHLGDEVVVLGKLTADGIVKQQFGSASIAKSRADNSVISIGDDLKSAASDAIKKCATLLGIGLHLYGELDVSNSDSEPEIQSDRAESNSDEAPVKPKRKRAAKSETPAETPTDGMSSMSGNHGNNLVTKEQLAEIKRLRTEKKLSPDDVRAKCQRLFGTTEVTSINVTMANSLISYLRNNGGNADI